MLDERLAISTGRIRTFQKKILAWYAQEKRDLPWRHTHNPYEILVSEVMLQQTQVSRVIQKYTEWLQEFPTVEDVAQAPQSSVLRLWSGLGYNRRALYLQQCAQKIVTTYQSQFPKSIKELRTLPGIGQYTASAILCFAFNKQVPVVDTNVRKVLITEFYQDSNPSLGEVEKLAEQLLPQGNAYDWNQALMDYASIMLKHVKIPIQKQSKFVGSNRYFRGAIMRILIHTYPLSRNEIQQILIGEKKEVTLEKLGTILKSLEKDTLIHFDNKTKLYTL